VHPWPVVLGLAQVMVSPKLVDLGPERLLALHRSVDLGSAWGMELPQPAAVGLARVMEPPWLARAGSATASKVQQLAHPRVSALGPAAAGPVLGGTATRSGISTGREGPVAPVPEPVLPFRD